MFACFVGVGEGSGEVRDQARAYGNILVRKRDEAVQERDQARGLTEILVRERDEAMEECRRVVGGDWEG